MPSNMFLAKRGASVDRRALARINSDRDARQWYAEESARIIGADGPVSFWYPNGTASPLGDYVDTSARRIAEQQRKANVRMLADNIAHLKMLVRGR